MAKRRKDNSNITFLIEGLRIFSRNIKVRLKGMERYDGDDEQICKSIIGSCYDEKDGYFRASAGNYIAFYSRDFGWCIESLRRLGYAKEVESTLEYAMGCYSRLGEIRVAISREGKPYNFPDVYSPDSVAYMFRSLRIHRSKRILSRYRRFLNSELKRFEDNVIDNSLGTVKRETFSGMRDHVICKASCYDMIMACMLCDEVDKINRVMGKGFLDNILKKYGLKDRLIKDYWTGKYFRDGPESDLCSGHANVYPYFLGIIEDKEMMRSSIKSIKENRLDKPFPLKYGYDKDTRFISLEFFAKDWEKDTVWAMLGMAYIDVLSRIDKKDASIQLDKYKKSIGSNKGFVELYDGRGLPYRSLFYTSDNSMLWASMYLDIKLRVDIKNVREKF